MQNWNEFIFSDHINFRTKTWQVFAFQMKHNAVYRRFCEALEIYPDSFGHDPELASGSGILFESGQQIAKQIRDDTQMIDRIPLLPIGVFKDVEITCHQDRKPELLFQSSGTGSVEQSRHLVNDASLYQKSLLKGFDYFYNLDNTVIWGYTPGYAENPHSSLIWMINELIKQDSSGLSRFLPLDRPLFPEEVQKVRQSGKQLILFGAAFGLLDLSEREAVSLPDRSIVIETGGMKTYRRQMSRKGLHRRLASGFSLSKEQIHSEYGMAELLSQAYATGGKWFRTVPWMSISIRCPDNPSEIVPPFEEGLIGVIDLSNVHSCSFILTGDKGVMDKKGRFQVLGRWNHKDLRGCNFLIEED